MIYTNKMNVKSDYFFHIDRTPPALYDFLVKEANLGKYKDYSPREIFDIVEKSGAKEFTIDLEKKTITIDNRTDLFKVFSSFNLITFAQNDNFVWILDKDGVQVLSEISERIKFNNSFEKDSPNFDHPITAKLGESCEWRILGVMAKAKPTV